MAASKKAHNSRQITADKALQTPRGELGAARKGFKRPTPELKELLRLANLVPPDIDPAYNLPYSLPEDPSELPSAVRLELFEHLQHPERWHVPLERMVEEIRERIRQGKLPDPNRPDYSEKYLRQSHARMEQAAHYRRIFRARENFGRLVAGLPYVGLIGEIGAVRTPDGKTIITFDDDITQVLQDKKNDLTYLRRCPIETCRKFFFAGRMQQPGDTPAHSDAIRKRKKRERDKANLEYKNKTGKKRRQK